MIYKIKAILTKKQLIALYIFALLSFITMILETAGIGLIIPFIEAISMEGTNQKFIKFLNFFKIHPSSKQDVIYTLIAIIGFVYTIKVIFLTFYSYLEAKLLSDFNVSISNRLYDIYLNKPYSFHLSNNSAKLTRNIDEVSIVVGLIKSSILLFNETIVFIGISAFVIFYDPFGSLLVIFFLGTFGFLFFKKTQNKLQSLGETRQLHRARHLKYLREGFRSIRDIKILQRAKEVVKTFTSNNFILNLTELKRKFISSLPRLWLEWLVVISFILLTLLMVHIGRELKSIVPLLGLFAAAAFRIMPSLTKIMNSIQFITFYKPAFNSVYQEFTENELKTINKKEFSENKINFKKDIDLSNISFKFSKTDPFLLNNINLKIEKGSVIGLIGESGAGKTTLINIILGLIQPFEGKIRVDGEEIHKNIFNWQKQIGYVPQDIYLSDDSIKKNIAFGLPDEKIDDILVQKAIQNVKLDEFINGLKNGLNTKIGEFGDKISGGQRQRIAIARALYNDPQVLIFDEFTNSLDLETEKEIMKQVNSFKGKKTIIIIAHRISTLENCDNVFKLDREGLKLHKFKNE